jgi:cobalt-zinc-cadmium resistance protein CzcA
MIDRLIRSSFGHPVVALVLGLCATVFGALAFRDLPRDVFPDLSAPVFNVIVQNAAMSAEELETTVAVPLEAELAGLPDVRRVRSNSLLGVTQVTVEFELDADYHRSRQFVAERLAQAASALPPGTDPPLLSSLTGRLNEIFEFTLEADGQAADLMALRDLAEFEVRQRLLAVPGVAAVERLGGYLRQFQVQADPDRMRARGVSLADVVAAVEASNANASGGIAELGATEWTIRVVGRATTPDDLRRTAVRLAGGVPVLIGDVADVVEAPAPRRGLAHRLKGEVVSCRVAKQFGADTVHVAAAIRRAVDDIARSLPKGIVLKIVYDQSALVTSALDGVGRAVLLGAGFVVIVLFVLLGNVRAAAIVTCTIPVSIAVAALLLRQFGIGVNTMTLGGLAIAVGLLVDAAIIVTENILHRLGQAGAGASGPDLAQAATAEVGRPITFATLVVAAVFAPIFTMGGIEGRMYQPLAASVVATLASALVLGLTVVPVVAAWALRRTAAGRMDRDTRFMSGVKAGYGPVLGWTLRHPRAVALAAAALSLPALAAGLAIGSDFMPALNEGAFLLQTSVPTEASLGEVDRLNHRVEDVLRSFPEVEDVIRRTGRAERTEDPMPHTLSDVLVRFKPGEPRDPDAAEDAMREALEHAAGITVLFTTPLGMRIDEGLGGSPADLTIRVFGPDLETLARQADRVRDIVAEVPGIGDLRVEQVTGLPQLRITVDRQAAAREGLPPGAIVDQVRIALAGHQAGEVLIGQRRFDLVVRLRDEVRNTPDALGRLLLDSPGGGKVALNRVARVEQSFGPSSIRREAGSRRLAVEATLAGRDAGSAAAEVRERLTRGLEMPAGYFWDIGGRVETQARATRALGTGIAVALVAVFLLITIALGSALDAVIILLTLPVALAGAVVALLVSGGTWNVSSLVGMIGLFGIAVQNSLVLLSQTRALERAGHGLDAALREASLGRVRPKLMTAATAVLGLLPILTFRMHGTEIERPLAVVMVGGLVTSTVFTLLVLPAVYRWSRSRRGGAPV